MREVAGHLANEAGLDDSKRKNRVMSLKEEKRLQVPGIQGQRTSLKKTGMTTFVIPAIYSWQFGDLDLAMFCGILDP